MGMQRCVRSHSGIRADIAAGSDVRALVMGSLSALARRDVQDPHLRFSLGIVLATIPIVIAGLLLSSLLNACDSPLRSLQVIGLSCIVMGLLLAFAQKYCNHTRQIGQAGWLDFIIVGVAQVGALIPGVSRSGSTLTAALFLGFKREDAARLSFLLGLPAITLAGLKEIWVLTHAGLDLHAWSVLAVGLVCGSISAFIAVWGLLRVFERMASWPFVIYRGLMGLWLLYSSL